MRPRLSVGLVWKNILINLRCYINFPSVKYRKFHEIDVYNLQFKIVQHWLLLFITCNKANIIQIREVHLKWKQNLHHMIKYEVLLERHWWYIWYRDTYKGVRTNIDLIHQTNSFFVLALFVTKKTIIGWPYRYKYYPQKYLTIQFKFTIYFPLIVICLTKSYEQKKKKTPWLIEHSSLTNCIRILIHVKNPWMVKCTYPKRLHHYSCLTFSFETFAEQDDDWVPPIWNAAYKNSETTSSFNDYLKYAWQRIQSLFVWKLLYSLA